MVKAFTVKPERHVEPEPIHEDERFVAIELLLGKVLRIGVLAAAAIIVTGVVLFLLRERHDVTYDQALGKHQTIQALSPRVLWEGLRDGSARSVIFVGVLVLILTPIMRVAMTIWLFFRQRDWIFVASAAFVLIILLLGIAGIGV